VRWSLKYVGVKSEGGDESGEEENEREGEESAQPSFTSLHAKAKPEQKIETYKRAWRWYTARLMIEGSDIRVPRKKQRWEDRRRRREQRGGKEGS